MELDIPLEARILYLERRHKDLEDCSVALKLKDFQVFERVGHQLRGNAEPFGFDELADIGASLETAAKEKNIDDMTRATGRFESYLSQQSLTLN